MRASLVAYAFVLALSMSPAIAQQPPHAMPGQQMPGPMMGQGRMGAGPGPGMMGAGMMGGGSYGGAMPMMGMMGMMDPTRHVEGRLAFIKAELRITDAQMPKWNAYAEAFRANAKRRADLHDAAMPGGPKGRGAMGGPGMMKPGQSASGATLPDRLGQAEQHMTTHLEMLRAMKGPTMDLYAALSDEQKRLADELADGPMGMMGMM